MCCSGASHSVARIFAYYDPPLFQKPSFIGKTGICEAIWIVLLASPPDDSADAEYLGIPDRLHYEGKLKSISPALFHILCCDLCGRPRVCDGKQNKRGVELSDVHGAPPHVGCGEPL